VKVLYAGWNFKGFGSEVWPVCIDPTGCIALMCFNLWVEGFLSGGLFLRITSSGIWVDRSVAMFDRW